MNHRFNNLNLPITMTPSEYGEIRSTQQQESFTRYIVRSVKNKLFEIDLSLNKIVNNVTLLGPSDLKWKDTLLSEGLIQREIGKSTIYFLDGVEVLRKQILNAKPFSKLQKDKYLQKYIVTFDIETVRIDNQLTPYLICAYNGSQYITSYISSVQNQKELFTKFFNGLLTFFRKGKILSVYAHNLSNFDGVFLLEHLIKFGNVEPLYHNGKLIYIKLTINIKGCQHNGKTIIFKDSYLLLPVKLRALCEVFKVDTLKSFFPYLLNNITYSGVFPKFEYWTGISPAQYDTLKLEFKNKMWSFQLEAIKYCKLDCKSLHEVLMFYNKEFFNKFNINIFSALTAPSLAMKLFKTHFMLKDSIYQLHGQVEKDIRESYTGGAVDVYKPHNKIGSFSLSKTFRTIKGYDVNALYPTVMAQQPMPLGKPIKFVGDIRKVSPNAYGFFYCKITSPVFLDQPILQRRINTSEGMRTVAGLGTWYGWINSAEMDNAVKSGYTFEILRGYEFETGDLFSKFVNTLYELRMLYPKGHPLNHTSKLMVNSLYGKFGMRTEFTRVDIYSINSEQDKATLLQLLDIWGSSVKDFVLLDDSLVVIRDSTLDLRTNPEGSVDNYHGVETNIAIASTITAGARINMSYFKNNPKFHIYYSDTDSAFIDGELPEEMVGKGLGQLKLEYVIKKAVFLAPKVYALVLDDGTEIIKCLCVIYLSIGEYTSFQNLLMKVDTTPFERYKSLIGYVIVFIILLC